MNQYFNRIFEECDFTVSGENASMEAEMLSIARKVFKSNTLEEYIAPFAHLLYALEMDSPAKFEEYSHVILERTYDIFLERYLAAYPDLPYLRVAVFASNLAETIGEGVYYYLTRAEEMTVKVAAEAPEGTHPEALAIEAMRQCVLEALDYPGSSGPGRIRKLSPIALTLKHSRFGHLTCRCPGRGIFCLKTGHSVRRTGQTTHRIHTHPTPKLFTHSISKD